GKYRAAAMRFEEATKWDGTSAEAYLRLGEAKEKQHDKKAAAAAYAKYLEIAPDAKEAADVRKRLEKLKRGSPPLTALLADDGGESLQTAVPIREKIDVVDLAADLEGNAAVIEAHRNQEGLVQRNAARAVQGIPDFRLKRSLLAD